MTTATTNIADSTQQTNATTTATPILLLGHDGEWWDFWMIISLALVAFAGAAVVFFTAGSIFVHKREAFSSSNELEKYKAETARKVADAKTAGIAAGEKAGHAQADIDAAKIELAKQTTLTANAQLETEKLKRQMSWRTLSVEQQSKFVASMSGAPPPGLTVFMNMVAGDAEGAQYAEDIGNLLRKVGLSVNPPGAAMFVGRLPEGIFIKVRDRGSPAGRAAFSLQRAFKDINIDAPGALVPGMKDDLIEVLVGIKPRPKIDRR